MYRRMYFRALNFLWGLATDDKAPFELERENLKLRAKLEYLRDEASVSERR